MTEREDDGQAYEELSLFGDPEPLARVEDPATSKRGREQALKVLAKLRTIALREFADGEALDAQEVGLRACAEGRQPYRRMDAIRRRVSELAQTDPPCLRRIDDPDTDQQAYRYVITEHGRAELRRALEKWGDL